MATGDPRGFNKRRSSKFREGSRVRQTPEEGRRTYWPKRWGNNNKDEDNSPKNLNDKNTEGLDYLPKGISIPQVILFHHLIYKRLIILIIFYIFSISLQSLLSLIYLPIIIICS